MHRTENPEKVVQLHPAPQPGKVVLISLSAAGTKMGRPLNNAYFPPNRRSAQLHLWGYSKR